jgi:hypothetical protein
VTRRHGFFAGFLVSLFICLQVLSTAGGRLRTSLVSSSILL